MPKFKDIKISPYFSSILPADKVETPGSRQVEQATHSYVQTKIPKNPSLLHYSKLLLHDLDIKIEDKQSFLEVVSGAAQFKNFKPYAMNYGGHQFGQWAGQLGDGRATNIAEVTLRNKPWTFQLKGAGPTPYSRRSDGLAVLRSSIREYLCSEAMHHLGIPTTRALSIIKTGNLVVRDMLYNGNPKEEEGAIVCRVSNSFLRFGSFQILAAKGEIDNLQKLLDFTIKTHYPEIGKPSIPNYLKFFEAVGTKTRKMIISWQRVGFVHGVMNTDNMSILGQTIDYGPYGWLEDYNPYWTPNTTDAKQKRYRFGNQPSIALWNLTQLANAIYPLINNVEPLEEILKNWREKFIEEYHSMICSKLGLFQPKNVSIDFISKLEEMMTRSEIDMTIFYRNLAKYSDCFQDFYVSLENSSYLSSENLADQKTEWIKWYDEFANLLKQENEKARAKKMNAINPKYVLRNWMAQMAIDEANKENYELIDKLYNLLLAPYEEQPKMEKWFTKRPEWARHKVGCSMLSCSS